MFIRTLNKRFIVVVLLLTHIAIGQNQNQFSVDNNKSRASLEVMSFLSNSNNKSINAKGSPYIPKDFVPIKIKGYEDLVFSGRFNAFNGEMEINQGEKIMRLDNSASHEVTFPTLNTVYVTCNYITKDGKEERGFLRIMRKDKNYTFFKKETIEFHDKTPVKSSYDPGQPAEFKPAKGKYFLFLAQKSTNIYFPTNKKELLKLFPKIEKKLKSFIKERKLSTKKDKDLIEIANYIALTSKDKE